VFDVGHFSFRAGYAGEDTPKAEVPAMVGVADDPTASIEIDTTNGNGIGPDIKPTPRKKYTIDTCNIAAPKAGMLSDILELHIGQMAHLNCGNCLWFQGLK